MPIIKKLLPPRNYQYQQRIFLENKIDKVLSQKLGIIALIGAIGKGKTEIAKAYAYGLADSEIDTGYELVAWIDCSTDQSYLDSWTTIQEALGSKHLALSAIRDQLEKLSKKCLLIFDNAQEEISPGQKLIDQLPSSSNIKIIITATSPYWEIPTLPIPEFTREESSSLVERIFDDRVSSRVVERFYMAVQLSDASADFPAIVAEVAMIASRRSLSTREYIDQVDMQEFKREPTIHLPLYLQQVENHFAKIRLAANQTTEQLLWFIMQLGVVRISRSLLEIWRIKKNVPEDDLMQNIELLIIHGLIEAQSKSEAIFTMPLPIQLILRTICFTNNKSQYANSIADTLAVLAESVRDCSVKNNVYKFNKEDTDLLEVHIRTLLRRLSIFEPQLNIASEIANNLDSIVCLLNFLAALYLSRELLQEAQKCNDIVFDLLTRTNKINTIVIPLFAQDYDIAFPVTPAANHLVTAVFDRTYCTAHSEVMPYLSFYTDALYNAVCARSRSYNLDFPLFENTLLDIEAVTRKINFVLKIQEAMLSVLLSNKDETAMVKLKAKISFTREQLVLVKLLLHQKNDPNQFDDENVKTLTESNSTEQWLKYYIKSLVSEHNENYLRGEIIYRLPTIEHELKRVLTQRNNKKFRSKKGFGLERDFSDSEFLNLIDRWYLLLNAERRKNLQPQDFFIRKRRKEITSPIDLNLATHYQPIRKALEDQQKASNQRKKLLTSQQLASPYDESLQLVKKTYPAMIGKTPVDAAAYSKQTIICLTHQADLHTKRYEAFKNDHKKNEAIKELTDAIKCYQEAERVYNNHFYHQGSFDLHDIYHGLLYCYFALQDYANQDYDLNTVLYCLQRAQENCSQFHLQTSHDVANDHTSELHRFYQKVAQKHHLTEYKYFYDIRFFLHPDFFQERLDNLNGEIKKSPNNIWLYLQRGDIFLSTGEWQAAIANYEQFLSVYPYSVLALMHRAMAYAKLNQYIKAIVDFEYVLNNLPGQSDNPLLQYRLNSTRQIHGKMIREVEDTIPTQSELGFFITKFTEIFATKLEKYLKIADGTDKRIPGYAIAGRVMKSIGALIPDTAKIAGVPIDLPPVDKAIGEMVDLTVEIADRKREFLVNKIARTAKDLENELDRSEQFKSFAQELALKFKDQIRILDNNSIVIFARYLAKTILHYLGSDAVPSYLSLDQRLREGIKYEYKKKPVFLNRKAQLPSSTTHASSVWQAGLFTAARVISKTGIHTADGLFFDPPEWGEGPSKYGYRFGTIEEAIQAGYKERHSTETSSACR